LGDTSSVTKCSGRQKNKQGFQTAVKALYLLHSWRSDVLSATLSPLISD